MSLTDSQSSFTGVWKLDCEKSTVHGVVPAQVFIRIEHQEPTLVQQILLTSANGEERLQTFRYEIGVEVSNSVGGVPVRTCARWEGTELLISSWMRTPDRELHFKDYWSMSNDGKTLTMEHRDDDLAGQISLLERASQADMTRFDKY
jgi:hypothetical protein